MSTTLAKENTEKQLDEVPRQPTWQLHDDAESRGNKARIVALEDRVQALEHALQQYTQVDVGLGYLDDQQQGAERRIEELEDRLAEWEQRWESRRGLTATTMAPPAYPAPPPPPMQPPLPMVVVVPATPDSSQGQVQAPCPQAPASSPPPRTPSTSAVDISGLEPVSAHSVVPEGCPVTQPGEVAERILAPDTGNAEYVSGNAKVSGADAEMAAPTPDDSMPPPRHPGDNHTYPRPTIFPPPFLRTQSLCPRAVVDHGPLYHPRRSPRLQSPAPPAAEDGALSMEVDK